jgi:GNAT superfamily N-acetyltransferase
MDRTDGRRRTGRSKGTRLDSIRPSKDLCGPLRSNFLGHPAQLRKPFEKRDRPGPEAKPISRRMRILGEMRIETATVDALDVACRVLLSQFDEHGIGVAADELREAVRALLVQPGMGSVLLAYDPDPVGIAVLAYTWTLEHGGRVAWLDELFVFPKHRGRGVGLAMLRKALAVAREAGCRAVDLEVDVDHARAEHLYERERFRRLVRNRWVRKL